MIDTPLMKMTLDEVAAKAQEIADSYAPPFRKVAYNACMEAFAEAVKIDREGVIADKTLPSPRTPVLR